MEDIMRLVMSMMSRMTAILMMMKRREELQGSGRETGRGESGLWRLENWRTGNIVPVRSRSGRIIGDGGSGDTRDGARTWRRERLGRRGSRDDRDMKIMMNPPTLVQLLDRR